MSWNECKYCDTDLEEGTFGDNAYCPKCDITFETDWDYVDAYEGTISSWLTGQEVKGKQMDYEFK